MKISFKYSEVRFEESVVWRSR